MNNPIQQLLLGVISLLALSWASSCGPLYPDPPAPENVLLDREFMDYVGLPDNSYWIYRNVLTGELDSSYIGVTDTQMVDLDYGRQKVEYLHERRLGNLKLRGSTYLCRWYTNKGERGVEQVLTKTNYFKMSSEEIGVSKTMSWKDNHRNWQWHKDSQSYTLTSFYDEIQLGTSGYQNVVHIETGDRWENKTVINHTYYAKGMGPVYRVFSDSSEWELIRYKLGEYVIPIGN